MLIKKPNAPGDILAFKLINGDEVVAKLVETTTDGFVVSKPCTVLPSPKGMGLVQSLFTASQDLEVRLQNQHVIMHGPVVQEIRDYYIKTTTGIETVSSLVV